MIDVNIRGMFSPLLMLIYYTLVAFDSPQMDSYEVNYFISGILTVTVVPSVFDVMLQPYSFPHISEIRR